MAPWTVRVSTGKPMYIQERQRNNWHGPHSNAALKEMPGTECGLSRSLYRSYQSIWHSQSWGTLENYGKIWLSGQVYSNGAAFHNGMLARVKKDSDSFGPFPVTNGGCILASKLFTMMITAMLIDAFQVGDNGIPIRYHFYGNAS